MKTIGVILGFVLAAVLHAGFLLFGGLLFAANDPNHGTLQVVELISEDDAKNTEEKPEEKTPEDLKTEDEPPPDAAEIMRNLDKPSIIDDAPALAEASLAAIEAALNGQGGSGDFASALDLKTSGGRIGGTGSADGEGDQFEDTFSLSEIDQKPRAVFQTSPMFPSEMRGKKVEGVVTIIFVVDAAGKVSNPRVEKSSHTAFEKPALDAVRKWKFEAGVKGGQRVASKMRVDIRFPAS